MTASASATLPAGARWARNRDFLMTSSWSTGRAIVLGRSSCECSTRKAYGSRELGGLSPLINSVPSVDLTHDQYAIPLTTRHGTAGSPAGTRDHR